MKKSHSTNARKSKAELNAFIDERIAERTSDPDIAAQIKQAIFAKVETVLEYGTDTQFYHENPVRLEFDIPIERGKSYGSWIGGNPCLPETEPWPEIDGTPCDFSAQVCCADLPKDLWGGLGPREGWILFFTSPSTNDVRVLHMHELGIERTAPRPPEYYGGQADKRPRYNEVVGDESNLAPRWPLKICPITTNDANAYRKIYSSLREKAEKKIEFIYTPLTTTYMRPFNAALCKELVKEFDAYLTTETNEKTKQFWSKDDEMRACFTARCRTRKVFEALKQSTFSGQLVEQFSEKSTDSFIQALMRISTSDWWLPHMNNHPRSLGEHKKPWNEYSRFLELFLRMQYTKDSASIPQLYREPFEQHWQNIAAFEHPFMGGLLSDVYPYSKMYNPVLLLEYSSSYLLDWQIGDVKTRGFFIPPNSLKDGNWSEAWSDISD